MESMDNVREQIEALEQQTEPLPQQTRMAKQWPGWWLGIACGVLLLSLVSLAPPSPAADFSCAAGDVACLIAAINTANANGEANTITLKAGTYTLTAVDNTTDGPNGLPSITSTLTIQGAGVDRTIIEQAGGAQSFRLVHVAATGVLTLEGLTLRGGGAVRVIRGAGLLNNGGTVILANTRLTSNTLTSGEGGGLFNNNGTVFIVNSTVDHNGATGGGGLLNEGGFLSLIHSTLSGNGSDEGGGLLNSCARTGPSQCGTATISESTIVNNFARGASGGGGIWNTGGTLTLLNSTVASNDTLSRGGGILNAGTLIITNATIAQNQAFTSEGGGIVGGIILMANTILARNTARLAPDCAGVTSLGTNLIGDPTGCTIQPTDLTGDPGLGPFTDNGTPGNGHFPLRPDSPAIDAANDAFCPLTDQLGQRRGDIRKVGTSICDIGAIEFRPHGKDPAEESD